MKVKELLHEGYGLQAPQQLKFRSSNGWRNLSSQAGEDEWGNSEHSDEIHGNVSGLML